jgi:eukaryotic-like serine/threonine-protein kinase
VSDQPPATGRPPSSGGRRDSSSLRLPKSLVGCFPGDPAWAWGLLTDREDWSFGDLELPDDVFVDGPGSDRAPEPELEMEITGSIDAATQGRPDPRATARSTAMGTRRSGEKAGLPAPGSVIDKYRVEGLLGTGGFAAVYRATHLLLRVPVALKLLRPEVIERDPRTADQLCEEARFAALVNHPNVVRVFDVTRTRQLTYIVMEFIDGDSLAATLKRQGPLSPVEVLRIGMDIVNGLRAALGQGLIHRDIKPANILLPKTGGARIVDLGLVHRVSDSGVQAESAAGSLVGTPAYMAPEQAVDPERVDFRADVYALGATLYHAAVGRPPFSSKDMLELVDMHKRATVVPPSEVRAGVPAELSRLLLWMLEKDPAARATSYENLLAGMEEALDSIRFRDRFERLVGRDGESH